MLPLRGRRAHSHLLATSIPIMGAKAVASRTHRVVACTTVSVFNKVREAIWTCTNV